MDQTPIPFEFLNGQTYTTKGDETVWLKSSKQNGLDKRQATFQLTVFADGEPHVQPLIFFRGLGVGSTVIAEKKHYDPRVVVKFNPTAYANSENILQWIDEQLIPVLDSQPTLLALDLFGGHRTEDVLDTFLAHDITVLVIPGGCTSLIQPLDVSINRPFKDIFREILDEKLDKIEIEESGKSFSSSSIGRKRIATTWAVGEAWEKFCREKKHVIIRSFRAVGLALPIDGSADTEISIKGISTLTLVERLKNWRNQGISQEMTEKEITEVGDDDTAVDFEAELPRHEFV